MIDIDPQFLDMIRAAVGLFLLGIAGYQDLKTREISDSIWTKMLVIGVFLFSVEILTSTVPSQLAVRYIANIGVAVLFGWTLYFLLNIPFGGADVKAMSAIAVLFPHVPDMGFAPMYTSAAIPPWDIVLPLPFVVFLANSALIGAVYPLFIAARTIPDGIDHEQKVTSLLGRKVSIEELTDRHARVADVSIYPAYDRRNDFLQYIDTSRNGVPTSLLKEYVHWYNTMFECEETINTVSFEEIDMFVEESPYYEFNFRGTPLAEDLDDVKETLRELQEKEEVYITPHIPFVWVMFIGLFSMLTIGDLLLLIYSLI